MSAQPSFSRVSTRLLVLFLWVVLLAALFAQLEIQIEGDEGWAASLPTWRINGPPIARFLFGGREITGYHIFAFGFMFAAFHLPIALTARASLRLEARILGSLMLFWIVEDVLWFAMNPAYGLGCLTPRHAPWHPHWVMGVPVDYLVFAVGSTVLLGASFCFRARTGLTRRESDLP